ncbi:MAG: polysaccharide deacetylase family protein [bacterium]|nr:polysaccharide deacetylase family protein [bacterium]MDE0290465.1 polysaccharide deacetylase family protein [bacterium]
MSRWRAAAYMVTGLVVLSVAACSESPPTPDGAESISVLPGTMVESTTTADVPLSLEADGTTSPDRGSAGGAVASTSPAATAGADAGSVESDPAPIPETDRGTDAASSTDDAGSENEVAEPVSEGELSRADTVPAPSGSLPAPTTDILLEGPYRPDIQVRVDRGEIRAIANGTVAPRCRLVYAVEAAVGQTLTAALDAPSGVWLELRLDDDVLVSEAEASLRVEATLPAGGSWRVGVVSTSDDFNDYALTIRVLPPPPISTRSSIEPGSAVYLTFDDGPDPRNTPHILDILARYNARATFFVVGRLVAGYPDLFQRIVSEGHTVANHTWNHENLAKLSRAEFDRTIGRTEEILGEYATPCLRPPYGATGRHTRAWAAEHGLEVHMWSVSANDWEGLDAEAIADRILTRITDGSVVLMHDGGGNRAQTVRGLEIILEELALHRLRYEPLCI